MNTLKNLEDARLRAGLSAAVLLLALALAGCGGGAKDEHAGEGDKHAEGRHEDDRCVWAVTAGSPAHDGLECGSHVFLLGRDAGLT